MRSERTIRRGVTLVECVVFLIVLIVLASIAAIVPVELTRRVRESQDQYQLQQVHASMIAWSRANGGRLPTPGYIDRIEPCGLGGYRPGYGDEDHTQNHTAFLYSAMIAQKSISPSLVISPNEANERVWEKDDYDFGAYRPAEDQFWDPSFVADITNDLSGSNTSYAHLVLCGDRKSIHWRDRANAVMPMLGTRGTKQGVAAGAEFSRSPTLKLAGSPYKWEGFIVFGDNHVETLKSFTHSGVMYDPFARGSPVADNIFACEFNDGPWGDPANSSGDARLGITVPQHAEFRCSPIWDSLE